jgi:uncharacterized protein (TIGR02646 family)
MRTVKPPVLTKTWQEWLEGWETRAVRDLKTVCACSKAERAKKMDECEKTYRDLKEYLLWVFNKRCAYCESDIRHIDDGDVEHYRPKGNVKEAPKHGGYYWLMFERHNLLLSCKWCNQRRKHDHFPVTGAYRANKRADDYSKEKPLLLNPYDVHDPPERHLEFVLDKQDPLYGRYRARDKSLRGSTSIDIYGLNREELADRRQQDVADFLSMLIDRYTSKQEEADKLLDEVMTGEKREYSAALQMAADWFLDDLRKRLLRRISQRRQQTGNSTSKKGRTQKRVHTSKK